LSELEKFARVLREERESLLSRWRQRLRELPSARNLDIPTLNDHVPQFIDQLANELEAGSGETIAHTVVASAPTEHGVQRVEDGFDIVEVVAEYNILRGCIHDLAEAREITLRGRPFHILNRVFDGAIGTAVQTFAAQRALDVQRRREEHLAFVAHDLRTPLSAISTAANVLAHQLLEDASGRMLKIIHRNVAAIEALVAEVLKESAHVEPASGVKLERRRLELWPFVERLIHDMSPIAGTGSVNLANEVPDQLFVMADAGLLARIFRNLIANAIVHTPQGRIVIGAQADGGGGAQCWVSDNGSGIDPDSLDSIFEKFETDGQGEEATGLGLAIVRNFVESHGGEIHAESEPGVGATFRFTLPGH